MYSQIIFIQCVAQHPGAGGESIVTDGLFAAEELRRSYPEDFKILATTDVYFWDKGHANFTWEMDEFYKIAKFPVIRCITTIILYLTLFFNYNLNSNI